jgi:hypothetical protein
MRLVAPTCILLFADGARGNIVVPYRPPRLHDHFVRTSQVGHVVTRSTQRKYVRSAMRTWAA